MTPRIQGRWDASCEWPRMLMYLRYRGSKSGQVCGSFVVEQRMFGCEVRIVGLHVEFKFLHCPCTRTHWHETHKL